MKKLLSHLFKPMEPNQRDGRLVAATAVLLWLAVALGGAYAGHGNQIWRLMGVFPGVQSFTDARVVAMAWDNVRQGHDAYAELPSEVAGQHFNYPRVWLLPRFLGLGEQHTTAFAVAGIIFFYLTAFLVIGRLSTFEALVYGLVFCSPATMLAVERGNIDMIVFGIVVLGVMWATKRGWLAAVIFGLAGVLKLFPIFVLPVCLRENSRRGFFTVVMVGCAFLAYVLATLPDVAQIRAITPHTTLFGFGCLTLVDGIGKWLAMHGHENHFTTALRGLGYSAALVIALAAGWSGLKHWQPDVPPSRKLDAFHAGALIYIGVFLIGNNYEYRLIFLLLCMGQLFVWMQTDQVFRRLAVVALLAVIISVWQRWPMANGIPGSNFLIPVAQAAHWTLFASFVWFMCATLPDWVVKYLPGVGTGKAVKTSVSS